MTPVLASRLGADRSFERLYRKHAGDVYRYALVVLRNQADAEDVTQTTFLNAFRAMEQGERPRSPQNWLIAIAHNVCRQRFRQSQRRPTEVVYEDELAETDRRGRRDQRRGHPPRARPPFLQPALGARDARARGPQLPGDRRDPRPQPERGRDADLPRPPRAARAARGRDHLPRGRALDLAPARRAAPAQGEGRPARAPARVRRVRRLRPQPARPARRAQGAGRDPAALVARRALRRRRRGRRRRRRGQGGRAGDRCRGRDRRRLRGRQARTRSTATPSPLRRPRRPRRRGRTSPPR